MWCLQMCCSSRRIVTLPGIAQPGPHHGARNGVGARMQAPGGRVFAHWPQPGLPSCGFTTHRGSNGGRVLRGLGGSRGGLPRHPGPLTQPPVVGTWNVTSLAGKKPELEKEVERYQLYIVGLTSTQSLDYRAQLLERTFSPLHPLKLQL